MYFLYLARELNEPERAEPTRYPALVINEDEILLPNKIPTLPLEDQHLCDNAISLTSTASPPR